MAEKILTQHFSDTTLPSLKTYLSYGGYEGLKIAIQKEPQAVIEEVKKSKLRGLGGAGFPTGTKWGFLPKRPGEQRYLCVNADEGEPGTFKDRFLISHSPHTLLEGVSIACKTLEIDKAFIYLRHEYRYMYPLFEKAIAEAKSSRFLGKNILGSNFNLEIYLHHGAGAYICGEETALLESIEGKKGFPRPKPPFPAIKGLFGRPTVINNVETLMFLPSILRNGGEWFRKIGVETAGGTRVLAVSGHVKKTGCFEVPQGISLKTVIYDICGGMKDDIPLKAVIPGGASSALLTSKEIDVGMDFDSLTKAGTMAGSGAVMVLNERTCIVRAVLNLIHFFADESCGQCTPCREGTTWLRKIIHEIEEGRGKMEDLNLILRVCGLMSGKTICALADGAICPVRSGVEKFRNEFEQHIQGHRCPYPKWTWGSA
ncbi:MAG TPA: NADH-quinone oxidoreductase subunit NuoF [Bdellovibrionota bacterium]|nr:NADH-quinone oxidoreductase subunit NuoF [Bdellovibrionota bacterium]